RIGNPPYGTLPIDTHHPRRVHGLARGTLASGRHCSLWQMVFGQLDDPGECLRVEHSDVRKNLSVQLHLRKLKAMNQLAITQAPHSTGSTEANNPQTPEHPLADSAVPAGVHSVPDQR